MRDYDRAAEIGGALRCRLSEISFPLDPPIEREIQRQVYEYADELKAEGLPPERVIVAVKRTANDAGIHSTLCTVASTHNLDGPDKLLIDMVGWCIERYYGPTTHGKGKTVSDVSAPDASRLADQDPARE